MNIQHTKYHFYCRHIWRKQIRFVTFNPIREFKKILWWSSM